MEEGRKGDRLFVFSSSHAQIYRRDLLRQDMAELHQTFHLIPSPSEHSQRKFSVAKELLCDSINLRIDGRLGAGRERCGLGVDFGAVLLMDKVRMDIQTSTVLCRRCWGFVIVIVKRYKYMEKRRSSPPPFSQFLKGTLANQPKVASRIYIYLLDGLMCPTLMNGASTPSKGSFGRFEKIIAANQTSQKHLQTLGVSMGDSISVYV